MPVYSENDRVTHYEAMDAAKNRLTEITTVLSPSKPVVYLDYPVHDNVGDLLIHQGADAFLNDHKYNVLGRFSMHDFARRKIRTEPAIGLKESIETLDKLVRTHNPALVLHGGGNFGDIWPEFQQFREGIIARYPDSQIVMFPQSVHFSDETAADTSARVLGKHKNLHIFVRDTESLDFVTNKCGLPSALMPDTAHQLWGSLPRGSEHAKNGTLVQRRRDRESKSLNEAGATSFDWDDLEGSYDPVIIKILRKWQVIDNPLRGVVPNYISWKLYRDWLVNRAVKKFASHDAIETDRLHGVILGALLAKPVSYGDGTYGKLHRYASSWFAGSGLIKSNLR